MQKIRNLVAFSAFISTIEPKNVKVTLIDADSIISMQDELHQFEQSNVWYKVLKPSNRTIIRTRLVFGNNHDEIGTITRKKCRLVVKGYN